MTDEYGAMVNDEWQAKTEQTQRQTSFIATSREENKFSSPSAEYNQQGVAFHNIFISLRRVLQK